MSSYLVLLQVGFTLPRTVASRAVRSYRTISTLPAVNCLGGVFSAALSVGSRPPGVTWHFTLRSPDFPPPNKLSGDCLANLRGAYYLSIGTITSAFSKAENFIADSKK